MNALSAIEKTANAMQPDIRIVECPRDAMQGWSRFIPTADKIAYMRTLLEAGFDTLDFGSFVSPKAIPQMADTREVLKAIDDLDTSTKLLAIIANLRGAEEAAQYAHIACLGYPFSISETFQLRNTHRTIAASLEIVTQVQELCLKYGKELVIYISMGFGNPYGDAYDKDIVLHWVQELHQRGVRIISLADTVGLADTDTIAYLFSHLIPAFPDILFGAHFHSTPHDWEEKIQAAYDNGCRRFDSAIKGIGGCPMANDELVGNIATENVLYFAEKNGIPVSVNKEAFQRARVTAERIFS